MSQCLHCQQPLIVTRLECSACGVRSEGVFGQSRLGRLSGEMQELAEQILLAGGNLKEVAGLQSLSYPTLRKRVDGLITSLEKLRSADDEEVNRLLGEVELGRIHAEEAARRIKEMTHGS